MRVNVNLCETQFDSHVVHNLLHNKTNKHAQKVLQSKHMFQQCYFMVHILIVSKVRVFFCPNRMACALVAVAFGVAAATFIFILTK